MNCQAKQKVSVWFDDHPVYIFRKDKQFFHPLIWYKISEIRRHGGMLSSVIAVFHRRTWPLLKGLASYEMHLLCHNGIITQSGTLLRRCDDTWPISYINTLLQKSGIDFLTMITEGRYKINPCKFIIVNKINHTCPGYYRKITSRKLSKNQNPGLMILSNRDGDIFKGTVGNQRNILDVSVAEKTNRCRIRKGFCITVPLWG